MWTQLLSMCFGLMGIWMVVQWAITRFRMRAVDSSDFVLEVGKRLGKLHSIDMVEGPSLTGPMNFLLQARDRRLLVTIPANAVGRPVTVSIDVSWLGRWDMKESVNRVLVDYWDKRAEVEKFAACREFCSFAKDATTAGEGDGAGGGKGKNNKSINS